MSHCESELLIEIQEITMEQLHICILPSLNTKMLSKYLYLKQLSVHFFGAKVHITLLYRSGFIKQVLKFHEACPTFNQES